MRHELSTVCTPHILPLPLGYLPSSSFHDVDHLEEERGRCNSDRPDRASHNNALLLPTSWFFTHTHTTYHIISAASMIIVPVRHPTPRSSPACTRVNAQQLSDDRSGTSCWLRRWPPRGVFYTSTLLHCTASISTRVGRRTRQRCATIPIYHSARIFLYYLQCTLLHCFSQILPSCT